MVKCRRLPARRVDPGLDRIADVDLAVRDPAEVADDALAAFLGIQDVECHLCAQQPAAVANLVGYYLLGLPLGAWLGAPERLGLAGIWWGLALGLFSVAATLLVWIAVRGPRRGPALVARAAAARPAPDTLPDTGRAPTALPEERQR